jgi:hypothetical protein
MRHVAARKQERRVSGWAEYRCGRSDHSPRADVGGVSPVPMQMWECGRGKPSPGADAADPGGDGGAGSIRPFARRAEGARRELAYSRTKALRTSGQWNGASRLAAPRWFGREKAPPAVTTQMWRGRSWDCRCHIGIETDISTDIAASTKEHLGLLGIRPLLQEVVHALHHFLVARSRRQDHPRECR